MGLLAVMRTLISFCCLPLVQLFCAVIYLEKVLVFHTSQLRLPLRMLRVGSQQILQGEIIAVVELRIHQVGNLEIHRRIDRETQVAEVFLQSATLILKRPGISYR